MGSSVKTSYEDKTGSKSDKSRNGQKWVREVTGGCRCDGPFERHVIEHGHFEGKDQRPISVTALGTGRKRSVPRGLVCSLLFRAETTRKRREESLVRPMSGLRERADQRAKPGRKLLQEKKKKKTKIRDRTATQVYVDLVGGELRASVR